MTASLERHRPTWAEIDLSTLAENLRAVRRRVGSRPVLAVVKANAYGHGAVPVTRALAREGVEQFAVAIPEEGVELRRAGIEQPILILNGFAPQQSDLLLEHRLVPAIYRTDQVDALSAAAARRGETATAHLKVDTGMGRLGVPAADVPAFLQAGRIGGSLRLSGVFSHLAVADDPGDPFTKRQIRLFQDAIAALRSAGHAPDQIHLANSAAVMDHPPAWLTHVRPGLILYGYPPSDKVTPLPIRPVLSLKSRIIYMKEILPGATLGYGRTFEARRNTRVASLGLGYDDGLPRSVSNRGHVLVRGLRAPILGHISMDLTTVDVTDIPDASLMDEATVIGASAGETLGADRVAAWAGTISWEVLCGIGARVPRLYVRGAEREVVSRFGDLQGPAEGRDS